MAKELLLPDFVIRQNQVMTVMEEAAQMIEGANKYLAKLQGEGIPTDIATLKVICKSDEAFKEWAKKAESSYIGKLGFLPKEERERIHGTFEDLINRTASTRNCLNGFLFNNRGYEPIQDKDGRLSFDLAKIESDAEDKARKYFTTEDKKYFALLQGVEESFKKLQNFERTHQYIPYTSNQDFYKSLKGGFSVHWFVTNIQIGKMSQAGKKMMEEMRDDE